MTEHDLTITVTYPDGKEMSFSASAMGHSLGDVINMSLDLNRVLETEYTSIVISVSGNAKSKKPDLRVVQ